MEEGWIDFALKAGLHFASVGFFIGFGFWSGAWLALLAQKEVDLRLPTSIGIALLLGVAGAIWVGGIVALFGYPMLFIVPWPVSIRNVLLSFFLPFLEEFNYLFFISGLVLLLCALIAGWDIVREHKHSKLVEGFQRLGIVVGTVLGLALIAFGILIDAPWSIVTRIGVAVFLIIYGSSGCWDGLWTAFSREQSDHQPIRRPHPLAGNLGPRAPSSAGMCPHPLERPHG